MAYGPVFNLLLIQDTRKNREWSRLLQVIEG
jgi:hypothetical protein